MRGAFAALSVIAGVSSVQADAVAYGGVGELPCSELLLAPSRGELELAAIQWSYGYWTGFNVYLSADCRNQRDLSSLLASEDAAIELLRANCKLEPDWKVMVAAFNVLMGRNEISGSRSATCATEEGN